MEMDELLNLPNDGRFKKAIQRPQPVIAAIDGICAGAGARIAMAADMSYGTERSKVLSFNRVGLAGCDMGACAMLPRIIGQGGLRNSCSQAELWPAKKLSGVGFITS